METKNGIVPRGHRSGKFKTPAAHTCGPKCCPLGKAVPSVRPEIAKQILQPACQTIHIYLQNLECLRFSLEGDKIWLHNKQFAPCKGHTPGSSTQNRVTLIERGVNSWLVAVPNLIRHIPRSILLTIHDSTAFTSITMPVSLAMYSQFL